MPIRWDALLTRWVARALDDELAGARLRAFRFDGEARDLYLLFRERTLVWRLHPTRGAVLLEPAVDPAPGDLRHPARVRAVVAEPDERWIRIELLPGRSGPAHDVVVELMGNQWNALVAEGPERIVRHVLWTRATGRGHRVGARWEPPPRSTREGARSEVPLERWLEVLEPELPDTRAGTLVRTFAWTSPLVAPALLEGDLARGWERWRRLAGLEEPDEAVILETDRGPQPFGTRLPGVPARPAPDLLSAIRAAAPGEDDTEGAGAAPTLLDPALVSRLEQAIARARGRHVSLVAELDGLGDPSAERALGDLILARLGEIPSGAERTTVEGFDGAPVTLELDPARAPHENAARRYEEAARLERARERLPGLVAEADEEVARLEALLARVREGRARPAEVEAALPPVAVPEARGGPEGPARPYRTYRSSGGLEIRVGRGARHNDELTFRHSAPDDVWLHARHASGAHVILRWPGPGNPPARDLEEAAILAALHSRARTSGSVPVDWTRRKHVRRPRKAPPGTVVPDRVQTLFVQPDEALAERLAEDGRRLAGGG